MIFIMLNEATKIDLVSKLQRCNPFVGRLGFQDGSLDKCLPFHGGVG